MLSETGLIIVLAMFIVAIVAITLPIVLIATRHGGGGGSKTVSVGDKNIHVDHVGGDVIINSKVKDYKSTKAVNISGIDIWLSTAIFQSPALVLIATGLWNWKFSLAPISNILAYIAAILLIPAFIGELGLRPNCLLNRLFILPSAALVVLVLLGARFVPTSVLAGTAGVLLVVALASRVHRESDKEANR